MSRARGAGAAYLCNGQLARILAHNLSMAPDEVARRPRARRQEVAAVVAGAVRRRERLEDEPQVADGGLDGAGGALCLGEGALHASLMAGAAPPQDARREAAQGDEARVDRALEPLGAPVQLLPGQARQVPCLVGGAAALGEDAALAARALCSAHGRQGGPWLRRPLPNGGGRRKLPAAHLLRSPPGDGRHWRVHM